MNKNKPKIQAMRKCGRMDKHIAESDLVRLYELVSDSIDSTNIRDILTSRNGSCVLITDVNNKSVLLRYRDNADPVVICEVERGRMKLFLHGHHVVKVSNRRKSAYHWHEYDDEPTLVYTGKQFTFTPWAMENSRPGGYVIAHGNSHQGGTGTLKVVYGELDITKDILTVAGHAAGESDYCLSAGEVPYTILMTYADGSTDTLAVCAERLAVYIKYDSDLVGTV